MTGNNVKWEFSGSDNELGHCSASLPETQQNDTTIKP